MSRPLMVRIGLLAVLALFATLILTQAVVAQQYGWKCSRCGGIVGSGPSAPNYCPHCKIKLFSFSGSRPAPAPPGASSKSETLSKETIAIGIGIVIALLGLGAIVLKTTMRSA